MFKNKIWFIIILIFMIASFIACARVDENQISKNNVKIETIENKNKTSLEEFNKNILKDGNYKAIAKNSNESGYIEYVEITIKEGKIISVIWNGTKGDTTIREDVEAGIYDMKTNKSWSEQADELAKNIIENQGIDKIKLNEDATTDSIASVSIHIGQFLKLFQEAINQAK